MNFEEMKYIFLVLMNQFNINEFQKFMIWLEKLVEEYKISGSIGVGLFFVYIFFLDALNQFYYFFL